MFASVKVKEGDDLKAVFKYAHDLVMRQPDIPVSVEDGIVGTVMTADRTEEEFLTEWESSHNREDVDIHSGEVVLEPL